MIGGTRLDNASFIFNIKKVEIDKSQSRFSLGQNSVSGLRDCLQDCDLKSSSDVDMI